MGIRLGFLVAAYSANGLTEFGTANLQARDVVATINY
jgi:hypothetical protein